MAVTPEQKAAYLKRLETDPAFRARAAKRMDPRDTVPTKLKSTEESARAADELRKLLAKQK